MTTLNALPPLLRDRKIGLLVESDYVEEEIAYYRMRFAEEGAQVDLLTRLWGAESLTFTGHEYQAPLTVSGDLEQVGYSDLHRYAALIVPSGMVSDRLRYSPDPDTLAPAVSLLRRAFRLPRLLKVFSCHGLWLMSPVAELIRGRRVTCHNNLIGDCRNMGAEYVDRDVVDDGDLLTGRTVAQAPQLARAVIARLAGEVRDDV
ncbi:DJ-1/PfpI family protein [Kutzneria kofuensis]|uniref:Protease I n=1 Tax=Kutzneria kofuensis TaxID=103725 RepID=A0A7W9NLZ4_9PSEU|nr:DJ-1/PfpI family protein [Kutzneria kofuensis]MBB5896991.1 protease I [Kutzneria kofuensis]